jgi:asparagine synthase (glutamine-hydrolysing)
MCGIAGFLDVARATGEAELRARALAMADAVAHRGPDARGAWVDAAAGIALGSRRLAIIDLSELGAQPMRSRDGRFVLVHNGEIYNFRELAAELRALGVVFRGRSDTEVLVEALARWGVDGVLRRVNGMFALAAWEVGTRTLHLARDRFGEKPLYYGWCGDTLLFGSELKALRAHPAFPGEVDREALALYLRRGYVPAPHSIYRGIRKLPPASRLAIRADQPRDAPAPVEYWSASETAERAARAPFRGGEAEAVEELERRLSRAVGQRMVADVPLGAFLSGGIDSSTVVALMQRQSDRPVRTFTIGFSEPEYNEAEQAKHVAAHLGTDHTELYVTPREAMAVIPRLTEIYDEPFGDPSEIPTFLVAQLARRAVTVALSGDGGDELFGGYPRYGAVHHLARLVGTVPAPARRLVVAAIRRAPVRALDAASRVVVAAALPYMRRAGRGGQLRRVAALLDSDGLEAMYARYMTYWDTAVSPANGRRLPSPLDPPGAWPDIRDPFKRMMFMDAVTYLPDDILAKVDRASMAVSLEVRVPLLDPEVAAFAWSLPIRARGRGIGSKWPLRGVLARHVPAALVDRPKMGFGIPIDAWLRGPLHEWASALLDEARLRREGFLAPAVIGARWREHVRGEADWQYALWPVLMFQAWLEAQRTASARPISTA